MTQKVFKYILSIVISIFVVGVATVWALPTIDRTTNLQPFADSTYSIGSETNRYSWGWFDSIRSDKATTTSATTTNLAITGGAGTQECLERGTDGSVHGTGSACSGSQASSQAWEKTTQAGDNYITPTSTLPIYVTGASRLATINATSTNIGTLHIFTDFTTDDTGLVTNLNADLLDSQTGSYYLNWDNLTNKSATTTSSIFITNEDLSAQCNGATNDITTVNSYATGTLQVYWNNKRLDPNDSDYTAPAAVGKLFTLSLPNSYSCASTDSLNVSYVKWGN